MNATLEKRNNAPIPTSTSGKQGETVSATFVICVEAGPLETQSLWAIESLRKWGGRFADCEVIAVTPRRGMPLQRETLKRFKEMAVKWISFSGSSKWTFYGPFNKPLALAAAEEISESEYMIWLDSDVFVVREPSEFILEEGIDFTAHPSSCHHDIGSTGSTHEHDAYWVQTLKGHGISPTTYPMIPTQPGEEGPMRMYWQAGAFSYRRSTQLGATFLQATDQTMRLNLSSKYSGTYFHEQIGLAVAVHRQDARYRILNASHNFAVNKLRFDEVDPQRLENSCIIHYFGSAWPDGFDRLVAVIRQTRPDVADWVAARGPLADQRSFLVRGISRLIRAHRKRRSLSYAEGCRVH
jgi:hypothetical protein